MAFSPTDLLTHSLIYLLTHLLRQIFASVYVKFNNLCSIGQILMKLSVNDLFDISNYILLLSSLYLTLLNSTLLYFNANLKT